MSVRSGLCALLWIAVLLWPGGIAGRDDAVFRDVFSLMEEADRLSDSRLWPGFFPREIPAALFDGRDTYLFGFGRPPEGFSPVPEKSDVYVFRGRHEVVLGNRRARLAGTWIATTIPGYGPVANHRSATLADIAAVVLHEKFHVYQILRHPDWRPNDLVLMTYPMDTAGSLAARRFELEAFRRAVSSAAAEDAAAWVRTGLELRRRRLAGLSPAQGDYERAIQRLEGLAQYVEDRAAGRMGDGDALEDDFAPRGIRHLGYFEGSWIGQLLDRFDPAWKERIEVGGSDTLEEMLAAAIGEGRQKELGPRFVNDTDSRASADVAVRALARRRAEKEFFTKLGYRIELRSPKGRLHFESFDPFSFEALGDGRILHPYWVVCHEGPNIVRTMGRGCLTEVDERGRIVRIVLTGIRTRPAVSAGWNVPISIQAEGLRIDLPKGWVRFQNNVLVIDVE